MSVKNLKASTISMSQWRKVRPEPVIDITVKSNHFFSPTWHLINLRKEYGDEFFSNSYKKMLTNRKTIRKEEFEALFKSPLPLHLACYCGQDVLCHRSLALEWLKEEAKELGIEVEVLFEE